jgi:hypothetical protein
MTDRSKLVPAFLTVLAAACGVSPAEDRVVVDPAASSVSPTADDYPPPSGERAECYADCLASSNYCESHPGSYPGVDCYEKYLDCVVDCDETTEIERRLPIILPRTPVVAPR